MIQLEDVTRRFPGGQEALSGLTLAVETGEMVFVTGHSGAGKSTLLKLIALIDRPTSGQVIVDGQNTRRVKRRKIPAYRRQIGMVFQDHKLLYDRPVFDNVALPLVIAGAGDRLAPPKHARLLWDHWDRPRIHWFPGNHLLHLDQGKYLKEMAAFMREIGFDRA